MGPPSLAPSCHIHQKALGLMRSAFLFPSPLLHMADPFPARPKKPPKKSRECVVTDSETISATTEMSGRLLRMSEGNTRGLCQNKHTHSPIDSSYYTEHTQVLFQGYPGHLYPPLTNTLSLVLRNLTWPLSYGNMTTRRPQTHQCSSSVRASERSRLHRPMRSMASRGVTRLSTGPTGRQDVVSNRKLTGV